MADAGLIVHSQKTPMIVRPASMRAANGAQSKQNTPVATVVTVKISLPVRPLVISNVQKTLRHSAPLTI